MTPARNDDQPTLVLQVSMTVEADYRNRGAFPGLRLDKADRRSGTVLFFRVPLDFAREVLEDAQARKSDLGTGRGLPMAYKALLARLQADLDRADGVRPDPGLEEWRKAMLQEGCLPAGAVVTTDGAAIGTVAGGFTVYKVASPDGLYKDKHGRFDYRPGYVVATGAGDTMRRFFAAAGDVHDREGGITHLRLVHSA